jgi:uncharacterized protein (TIGR03437 family)
MSRSHLVCFLCFASLVSAAPLTRYALVLSESPVAVEMSSREMVKSSAGAAYTARLTATQDRLKTELASRHILITGSITALANAVFVAATPEQAPDLRNLPGVAAVVPMFKLKPLLNRAIDVVNARNAWTTLGGVDKAGAGVKIAIIDTGIDETHPGFKDPSLAVPQGFPYFNNDDDKTHTTNKVIVVRSYVDVLAIGGGTPEGSLDDDYSARDRVGHGTAVAMAAAGVTISSPAGTITGVAPKAWLGSYKVFGSPGVNDSTFSDVVMMAVNQAYLDGMDVALLSLGSIPALYGAGDLGSTCGASAGVFCDPWSGALSTAVSQGLTIVTAAGNDGDLGFNTINTPGTVPGVITVGASTNTQNIFQNAVTATPDFIQMRLSNGPQLTRKLTAPLIDVTRFDSTGFACSALPANSLAGSIVLIQRGSCFFATKVNNASAAGALAVVFFREAGGSSLYAPGELANSSIPSVLVNADAGAFLKTYLASHPVGLLTLDPTASVLSTTDPETVAATSSFGPNIGDNSIKPELVAPGNLFTATQNYDPNGYLYGANRYTSAEGTSFSAALVAGAVALVKQAHPGYSAAQLKSAVTNTAIGGVQDFTSSGTLAEARIGGVGAGKLNVQAAVASNVTIEPATVSFGAVSGATSKTLKFTNTGGSSLNLQLTVNQRDADAKASVSVSPTSLSLSAGQAAFVTVRLSALPNAGSYEGYINVSGGAAALRIPYVYLVSDGNPANFVPLTGADFLAEAGNALLVQFKFTDQFGLPVGGIPIGFSPTPLATSNSTDNLGIGAGIVPLSNTVGEQFVLAGIPGVQGAAFELDGRTRAIPQISSGGVVDAESGLAPSGGFAPGSYISIFGSGLSENTMVEYTSYLPPSLAGVSVSFDSPQASVHAPGHLFFVSPGQINVQIPWELQGSTSAVMKVTLSNSSSYFARADNQNLGTNQSQTVTVPIGQYSPAFFEYTDAGQKVVVAQDEASALVGSANPVKRGHALVMYVNGLGAVTNQPASGEVAPTTPTLASTKAIPTVTIGGQSAQVLFSGMTPGYVGLYQVNVIVPNGISTGVQQAIIAIGGVTSKTSNVQVQ